MVNQLLSEESKIKRNRKTTIGIQTTTISWILEFLGGSIVLLSYSLVKDRDECTDLITLLCMVSLNFILIPASYLMIPAKYKQHILEKGWCKSITTPLHNSNRIFPSTSKDLEQPNMSIERESSATFHESSINSISGSIDATEEFTFDSKKKNKQILMSQKL